MRSGIFDYFNFHRLKAKRRLTAFMNMRGPAAALEDGASLVAAIDDAIRRDEHLFEQEMLWRARRDPRTEHGGEARDMDRRLDGLLGGVHAALSAQVRLSPVDAERGAAASSMLEELFPEGLGGLTQRSYHEQAHATRLLLRRYRQSANQQALAAALGLDKALEELAALNAEFTAALNAYKPPSFEELEAERAAGIARLGAIIARVVGRFPTDSAEDQAGREALLEPIERQHEILSLIYRDRRRGDSGSGAGEDAGEDAGIETGMPESEAA